VSFDTLFNKKDPPENVRLAAAWGGIKIKGRGGGLTRCFGRLKKYELRSKTQESTAKLNFHSEEKMKRRREKQPIL